jgi:hypothetical protein
VVPSPAAWPGPKHPLDGKTDEQIFKELDEHERRMKQQHAGGSQGAKLPRQDPCSVLTDADVRKVIPDARPGRRARPERESNGVAVCRWDTDRGRHLTLYLEAAQPSGERESPDGDSLPGYRKLTGIGDEAGALVMRRDDKSGMPDMGFIGGTPPAC